MKPFVVHEMMMYVWEDTVFKILCCHSTGTVNFILQCDKGSGHIKW
jgi:hypothetical protein